jgi:hypothetical protein
LWQVFRAGYQAVRRPYVAGGVALLAGYMWSWIKGVERPISPDLIRFHRFEQMQRLRERLWGWGGGASTKETHA